MRRRVLPVTAGISAVLIIAAHGASLEDGKAVFERREDTMKHMGRPLFLGIGRVVKGTAAYGRDTVTAAKTVASLGGTLDRSLFLPGSDEAESKIKPAIFNAGDHVDQLIAAVQTATAQPVPAVKSGDKAAIAVAYTAAAQRLQCVSHRISQGRVMLPFQRQPIVAALTLMLLSGAVPAVADEDAVSRGEYLVRAGGCFSCHTVAGEAKLAGGRALATPFGAFYSPNITPDPETGIGRWTDAQFLRALREGVRPDGANYFPVFPYPSFTGITDGDALGDQGLFVLASPSAPGEPIKS
jgi:cytochrome c556